MTMLLLLAALAAVLPEAQLPANVGPLPACEEGVRAVGISVQVRPATSAAALTGGSAHSAKPPPFGSATTSPPACAKRRPLLPLSLSAGAVADPTDTLSLALRS